MDKVITFGEVMLRLATPGFERFGQSGNLSATFGGGEANVAVSLANYGIATQFITRLPKNDIADACIRELRGFGVDTSGIIRGGDRMGIYFLEAGAVSRASKVIYDRAGSSIAEIKSGMIDWAKVFKDATWFHWTGITPAISQEQQMSALNPSRLQPAWHSRLNRPELPQNLWNYGKKAHEVMPLLVAGAMSSWATRKTRPWP